MKRTFFFAILIGMIALGLKLHYSRADSDGLVWILKPTAILVRGVTGAVFEYQSSAGYLSRELDILIAPACAGVNFLIIAFVMAGLCGVWRFEGTQRTKRTQGTEWTGKKGKTERMGRTGRSLLWIFFSLLTAYGLTLVVNTIRIVLSIYLYRMDIYGSALTPAGLHRISGAFLYLLSLYGYYWGVCAAAGRWEHITFEKSRKMRKNLLFPLLCYFSMTIGVPLLNGAYEKNPDRFADHIFMVTGIGGFVLGLTLLLQWVVSRCKKRSAQPL